MGNDGGLIQEMQYSVAGYKREPKQKSRMRITFSSSAITIAKRIQNDTVD